MTKIIFNKNLQTEKSYVISSFFERVFDKTINTTHSIHVQSGEPFPTIVPPESKYFTTVTVEVDNVTMPIVGTYNVIKNFSTQYFDSDKTFSYSIDLGYEEV